MCACEASRRSLKKFQEGFGAYKKAHAESPNRRGGGTQSAEKVAVLAKPCRFALSGHANADNIIDCHGLNGYSAPAAAMDVVLYSFPTRRSAAPVLTVETKETLEIPPLAEASTRPRAVSILHVEDGPEVSEAVRELLEAEGWRVHVCPRGDEALRELQGGETFDLLILDHMLPGMTGVELTRRARRLRGHRRTPVIMLTASEVEREARVAGVDVFLRKPEGVISLAEAAARLLRASSARH